MEVRAKKSLGQHFLTDLSIAHGIVDALQPALTEGVAGETSDSGCGRCARRPATPLAAGGGTRCEAVGGVTSEPAVLRNATGDEAALRNATGDEAALRNATGDPVISLQRAETNDSEPCEDRSSSE